MLETYFVSFGVAILFAFFKKTEVIARSIVDLWIELIVQTVVTALMQGLVVTFFLMGARSGNGTVVYNVDLTARPDTAEVYAGAPELETLAHEFALRADAAGNRARSGGHRSCDATPRRTNNDATRNGGR